MVFILEITVRKIFKMHLQTNSNESGEKKIKKSLKLRKHIVPNSYNGV